LADGRRDREPNETTVIRFSGKRPASIRVDDPLLYYAAWHQKLFGVVSVFTKPRRDGAEDRWPWSAQVRPKVIIRDLGRAPSLDLLSEIDPDKDWHHFVQQMDYREISEEVFDYAAAALVGLAEPERGDILDRTFATVHAEAAEAWRSK
jgi:hypothetical protein